MRTTPPRSEEKIFPDVGGGFVEPHHRDGIDWSEEYPYKGTETIKARLEIHITPRDGIERDARRHTCAVHGLWLCNLCTRADGGIGR